MKQRMQKCALSIHIILFILALCGCSKKPTDTSEPIVDNSSAIYYQIQETSLPSPDEILLTNLSNKGRVRELDLFLAQNTVYRIAQTWDTIDGITQTTGYYLQILRAPYENWDTTLMPSTLWDSTLEYEGFQISPYKFVSASEEQILFQIAHYDENLERSLHLGTYTPNEGATLSSPLPIEDNYELLVAKDGNLYAYSQVPDNTLLMLDSNFEVVWQKNMDGQIYGLIESPDSKIYWYGAKDDGYGCWSITDAAPLCQGCQELKLLLGAAYDSANHLIFTDAYKLLQFSPDRKDGVELCNLNERNYLLDDVIAITAPTDTQLILLATMDGETLLLQLTQSPKPASKKQQIVLAMPFEVPILRYYISCFNRTNDQYEVTVLLPDENTNGLAFGEQIQLDLSSGKGPDLVVNGIIDPKALAQNGFLQSLDGIIPEEEYWDSALECGKINGVLYGIPYEAFLRCAAYSKQLTKGASQWNLTEFMQAVRASDAKALAYGFDGMMIVLYFGLSDNDNKEFIDWEKGVSHLSEEPFIEFLEFAYDYADVESMDINDAGKALQDGYYAAVSSDFIIYHLNYIQECFAGEDSVIGFPRSSGNGIYVVANKIYLKSNSSVKEGAIEFLKFISSKEMQMKYAENSSVHKKTNAFSTALAIRPDALERQIEIKKAEKPSDYLLNKMNGIEFQGVGLTKEREEALRFILENSQAGVWNIESVLSIVSEELDPYFKGHSSAKEVAEKLDNRIQLYLDENTP